MRRRCLQVTRWSYIPSGRRGLIETWSVRSGTRQLALAARDQEADGVVAAGNSVGVFVSDGFVLLSTDGGGVKHIGNRFVLAGAALYGATDSVLLNRSVNGVECRRLSSGELLWARSDFIPEYETHNDVLMLTADHTGVVVRAQGNVDVLVLGS